MDHKRGKNIFKISGKGIIKWLKIPFVLDGPTDFILNGFALAGITIISVCLILWVILKIILKVWRRKINVQK